MNHTVFADNVNVWSKGLKRPLLRLYTHEMGYGIYNTADSSAGYSLGKVENAKHEESLKHRLPAPLCCYLRSKIRTSVFLRLVSKQAFVCCIKCSYRVQIWMYERSKSLKSASNMKSKPKSKDYTCHICGRQFARKVSMNSHFPCRNIFSSV